MLESTHNEGDLGLISGQEDPWRREWLPTTVFLPREFHGQRSLVGYSPRGLKESDTTEQLTHTHTHIHTHTHTYVGLIALPQIQTDTGVF